MVNAANTPTDWLQVYKSYHAIMRSDVAARSIVVALIMKDERCGEEWAKKVLEGALNV